MDNKKNITHISYHLNIEHSLIKFHVDLKQLIITVIIMANYKILFRIMSKFACEVVPILCTKTAYF